MIRRKILITGATTGIGLALANRLSLRHDVMVTGSRAPEDITEPFSANLTYIRASQADPEKAAQTIAEALLKSGWTRLDNVVLNAGIGFVTQKALDDVDKIRSTQDVNVTSTILIARAVYPWLSKTKGTLTIVGSVAHKGQALFPAYAASKAALNGLARSLRSEWAGSAVVQILHPGPTYTDMHEKAGYDPGWMREIFIRKEPMAKMMEYAIARKHSPVTLSWLRYLAGGSITGKRL
ncbi:MAG: SDR family oxidoreductase [Pseudomonadota bacterium]